MALHPSALLMLGAAPGTRSSIAGVVDAYRRYGLLQRWPVDYIATHGNRGPAAGGALFARALRDFGYHLGRHLVARRGMVVHVHTASGAHFRRDALFMAAALAARASLVIHLHGTGFERSEDGPLMRWFFERASCVAVPCEALRAWVRTFARNAHAVVIPHPVSGPDAPSPDTQPDLLLFLGRMEASKGIFDLLDALARLRLSVPDVKLACAGDGDRLAVARYAERLGIADAVKFTGWVGPSGKRALLEAAAAFVLPSYDESLPLSLLEAMRAGVPPVVTPVGGIPEVAVDGVSALLVAPGDTFGLHRQLGRLLSDRALAARIGATARESASLRFAPERAVPVLEALYRSLGLAPTGSAPTGDPRAGGMPRDLRRTA